MSKFRVKDIAAQVQEKVQQNVQPSPAALSAQAQAVHEAEDVTTPPAAAPEGDAPPEAPSAGVQRWEYRVEILTTFIGRDKLRLADLQKVMKEHGDAGWELCNIDIDANVKGSRDGHLMIFKRPAA